MSKDNFLLKYFARILYNYCRVYYSSLSVNIYTYTAHYYIFGHISLDWGINQFVPRQLATNYTADGIRYKYTMVCK